MFAGQKKCMPATAAGRAGRRGDRVDVEIGGVGGEDRAGRGDAIELGKDLPLDRHVFEHRLDDDIRARRRFDSDASAATNARRRSASSAVRRPRFATHRDSALSMEREATLKRLTRRFDQRDRECRRRRRRSQCRLPIVPAPMTAARSMVLGLMSAGDAGTFAASRSAKKRCLSAFD